MSVFKILSLDGGGMKGVFSAAFLCALEEQLGKRTADYFDLVVGTSTGGIIGIALGLGISAKDILGFYMSEGKHIFGNNGFVQRTIKGIRSLVSPRHDVRHLETALRNHFGDKRLGHSKTRLVIPSFNPATGDVYLYKTAHHSTLKEDYKKLAWEVARSTSAAPTYFSGNKIGLLTHLVDGGLWANNPSMVAVTEAIGLLGRSLEELALLSVGTSSSQLSVPEKTRSSGGLLRWAWTMKDLFMHVQSITAHKQASNILRRGGRYVRIAPIGSDMCIRMDDPKKALTLIPFGERAARNNRSTIENMFFAARAPEFAPEYTMTL